MALRSRGARLAGTSNASTSTLPGRGGSAAGRTGPTPAAADPHGQRRERRRPRAAHGWGDRGVATVARAGGRALAGELRGRSGGELGTVDRRDEGARPGGGLGGGGRRRDLGARRRRGERAVPDRQVRGRPRTP